jgi:cell division protein FtsW
MMVAVKTRDRFMKLLAVGITLLVVVQVAVNIGALSGLIPLTGLPLPFLSYGGSALAFLLFEIGILLRISKHMNA